MTNGNAKFTRIMINDSASYSRVIRLTEGGFGGTRKGGQTRDAAVFFETVAFAIRGASNFRVNRWLEISKFFRNLGLHIQCIGEGVSYKHKLVYPSLRSYTPSKGK